LRLSELSGKELVDINRAERLGVLGQTDLAINESTGQIEALLIPTGKWFGVKKHSNEIIVKWSQIKKIGIDMMIIDIERTEKNDS
jgi:YlmC/YmxH family sporulation protein